MRKIALLTMPLLIFGLFSLSADNVMIDPTGVTAKVSGEATLTWGLDLDSGATGFTNEAKTNLEVTVIPKQSTDTGMMDSDDLYAYVKLKDFKWVANKDGGKTDAPSIEAKLIMGAFSITTHSAPTIRVDFVDTKDDDKEGDPGHPDFVDLNTEYTGSGGLTLGYKLAPVDLSLGVISANDWKEDDPDPANKDIEACHMHGDDPETDDVEGLEHVRACPNANDPDINEDNAYAFLGTIKLDIGDDAELEARVAYAHEYAAGGSDIGIGAKATFDLGDIDPHIAFDAAIPPGGDSVPFDVGAGLKWDISPNDDKSYFETNLMMHAPGGDADQNLGVSATLKEGDGDDGALLGMGAALTLNLYDLTSEESTWGVKVDAHYKVNDIKPFFMVQFTNEEGSGTSFEAGIELTMIEHLTSTLKYASDDITGGDDQGVVTAALKLYY